MLQQIHKKKKLFIYLLLLFLLTTINNLPLRNSEHLKLEISQTKVFGLNSENNIKISEEFNSLISQKNLFYFWEYLFLLFLVQSL